MRNVLEKIDWLETIIYLIFGVLTTFVSLILFYSFLQMGMDYKIANFLSICLAICFAYVTNKIFVFKSKCENFQELFQEMVKFSIARSFTAVVDMGGLIICVEVFDFKETYSKLALQVVVIVLNYILSKKGVFKAI